jgi:hypothetical protein
MNKTIMYGLIAGLIYAFFSFVLYLLGIEVLLGPARLLPFTLVMAAVVIFGFLIRKEAGGYMTYKEAFLTLLTMFIVAEAVNVVYLYLLYNVIDPELPQTIKNIAIEKFEEAESVLSPFMSPSQLDQVIEELESKDPTYRISTAFRDFISGAFFSLFLSLLAALILRKNRPLFE